MHRRLLLFTLLCVCAFARGADEPATALVNREVEIIERLDAPNCGPRESSELKKELKKLMLTHGDGVRWRNYGVQKSCDDAATLSCNKHTCPLCWGELKFDEGSDRRTDFPIGCGAFGHTKCVYVDDVLYHLPRDLKGRP